jgi:hypothetical protein
VRCKTLIEDKKDSCELAEEEYLLKRRDAKVNTCPFLEDF